MKVRLGSCWGMISALLLSATAIAGSGDWDVSVADFPRREGEVGDAARIGRAVEAAGAGGVVWFPRGEYAVDSTIVVSNQVSLLLHKSAKLKAVKQLPFVLKYFGCVMDRSRSFGSGEEDHNLFVRGGEIDGMGLASCAWMGGFRHFTIADVTFRNGRRVGLQFGDPALPDAVAGGYEIIANNLYFVCNLPGMAGNVGFLTYIGDSHFTDLVCVDYTVGIRDMKWSNRYTRCHVWGGRVNRAGTPRGVRAPEMLEHSIAFDLQGEDAVLTDCYADTAMIGFNVCRSARICNCAYYNNWIFKMDGPTVFCHRGGRLAVTGGRFSKNSPHAVIYARDAEAGELIWHDNYLLNFTIEETQELNDTLKNHGQKEQVEQRDSPLAKGEEIKGNELGGVRRAA